MNNCKPNEHIQRDNKFGVTWCVKCGRLFTKPCGKPLFKETKFGDYTITHKPLYDNEL